MFRSAATVARVRRSVLPVAALRRNTTQAAPKSPPPRPPSSRHALFYADLTSLAPVFILACATYLGLKLLRERCLADKLEFEAKERLAVLEQELETLRLEQQQQLDSTRPARV